MKTQGAVIMLALATNSINMFVPPKIGRHGEAEVFQRVDMLKLMSTHSIVIYGRLIMFACDADDFCWGGTASSICLPSQ